MYPRRGWGSLVAADDFPAIKRSGANRHVAEPGQRRPVANEPTFSAPTDSDSSDGRLHMVLNTVINEIRHYQLPTNPAFFMMRRSHRRVKWHICVFDSIFRGQIPPRGVKCTNENSSFYLHMRYTIVDCQAYGYFMAGWFRLRLPPIDRRHKIGG